MITELPALPVVISTALVDSINPCAIGVLILMLTTLIALHKDRRRMLFVGLIYIAVVYLTYFLAGIGLLYFIQKLNIAETLGVIVGILVIILGLIEMKDFWWYGQGISLHLPPSKVRYVKKYIKKMSVPGAIFLGFFVAAVELPCTGGPYLAITTLLAKIGLTPLVVSYLLLYNLIFVLLLLAILFLVYFGFSTARIIEWKADYRKWMRLAIGLIMIGLGLLLILFAIGRIHFGLAI